MAISTTTARAYSSPTMTTTVRLLERFGRILRWFAPILFAGQLITYFLINYSGGSMSVSIWESIGAASPYGYLCAMAIALAYIYLPLHVANGGTRRGFIASSTAMVVCAALLLAVMVLLGYLLESFVYTRYGWTQALDHQHLFRLPNQFAPLLLEYSLQFIFSGTLGLLVGGTYYRLGNLWATLLLVMMVLTAVALQRLLIDPWLDTSAVPLSIQMLVRLVLVVLILLVNYLNVRRVTVRSKID